MVTSGPGLTGRSQLMELNNSEYQVSYHYRYHMEG